MGWGPVELNRKRIVYTAAVSDNWKAMNWSERSVLIAGQTNSNWSNTNQWSVSDICATVYGPLEIWSMIAAQGVNLSTDNGSSSDSDSSGIGNVDNCRTNTKRLLASPARQSCEQNTRNMNYCSLSHT